MPQADVNDFQTEDYQIHIGSKDEDGHNIVTYEVINRRTGVTEYEDFLLPRVITTMVELQKRLLEAIDIFEKRDKEKPVLSITPGGKGEHTAH